MKKEEFAALGISEELAAKAEKASLKELEGYASKEQIDTANAEIKNLKQQVAYLSGSIFILPNSLCLIH